MGAYVLCQDSLVWIGLASVYWLEGSSFEYGWRLSEKRELATGGHLWTLGLLLPLVPLCAFLRKRVAILATIAALAVIFIAQVFAAAYFFEVH